MDFSRFFKHYNPYVNREWRSQYFAYDTLRSRYKAIKERSGSSKDKEQRQRAVYAFEDEFLREIRRVHNFIMMVVGEIDTDLEILLNTIEKKNASASAKNSNFTRSGSFKGLFNKLSDKMLSKSEKKLREQNDRTIELSLRSLYDKCKDIELFYHLNYYGISKISKKFEKLLQLSHIVVEVQQQTAAEIIQHLRVSAVENSRKFFPPSTVSGLGVVSVHGIQNSPRVGLRKNTVSPVSSKSSPALSSRSAMLSAPIATEGIASGSFVVEGHAASREEEKEVDGELPVQESDTTKSSMSTMSNFSTALPAVQVVQTWESTPCGRFFFSSFQPAIEEIEKLKQRCVDTYSKKFRITYSQLASYELEFVKNKDKRYESTNFFLGLKAGLIICLILLLALDTKTIHSDFAFWDSPGLYVYTTVGNLLLYRVCWWVDIAVWAKFDVNYLSILQMNDVKPNLLLVADQTSTLLSLFFIDFLLYFRSNTSYSSLGDTFLSFTSPIVLIGVAILYQLFEYFFLFDNARVSRGVFSIQVIKNLLSTPWVPVTFRDNYAANILSTFTRVISDSLRAACWIFSGNFLDRTKTADHAHCSGPEMTFALSYVQLIPLTIRFLQCCRRIRDAKFTMYPQAWNALKYVLSMLVVLSAQDFPVLGERKVWLMLVIVTAVYKWYWDVVMDWGLCEIWPQSFSEILLRMRNFFSLCFSFAYRLLNKEKEKEDDQDAPPTPSTPQPEGYLFLRKSLMYPYPLFYYVSIVLDLALRFLWVLSLVPEVHFGDFVGYRLKLFLGSMEILRRCLWSLLRVENEHLKMLNKKTPGFLQNRVMRRRGSSFETQKLWANAGGAASADKQHEEKTEDDMRNSEKTMPFPSPFPSTRVFTPATVSDKEKDSIPMSGDTNTHRPVSLPVPSSFEQDQRRTEREMMSSYPLERSDFLEKLKHFNYLHRYGSSGNLLANRAVRDPVAALSLAQEKRSPQDNNFPVQSHDLTQHELLTHNNEEADPPST